MADFVHLHLHTQYSLLDGAIHLERLFPRLKELGMPAVAITDHGNMFGALDFYHQAKKAGIKPIIGCEIYITTDRRDRSRRLSNHLILLAKNLKGYQNLAYLASMAYLEGYYYDPRIDKELLRSHSEGLFGFSACLGGEIPQHLLHNDPRSAREAALEYKDIFEPRSFFLELQDNGIEEQELVNAGLKALSRELELPLIATNDCHYLLQEDAKAHEYLMNIKTGKTVEDPSKLVHDEETFYLKSAEEMFAARSFSDVPESLAHTMEVAEACNVDLEALYDSTHLPCFQVPESFDQLSYLRHLAEEGLEKRFGELQYPIEREDYYKRLNYELEIIIDKGYAGYYLIVWDFINYAKEHDIPVGPGRGSGAGSLVAYAIRITDIDPLRYSLLFERFLNPERESMPDFDIDFCKNRRDEVINYVGEKYGKDRVAQIITYGALKPRLVIKDVGRVMGLSFGETDRISKLIPFGPKVTLEQALKEEPRLTELMQEKAVYQNVIEIGQKLEKLYRHCGVHAAGVVISDKPMWEHVPVCKLQDSELVTQFDMKKVETAGLVKFDFLGLKTLTVIDTAVKLINRDKPAEERLDISRIPLDDEGVYRMLASGNTDGVFQMESTGFTEMLKRLKPDRFEDLIAAVALYRPGPMQSGMMDDYINRKHGRAKITYPHAKCKPILEETYGVMIYQEQVMLLAVELSNYSMGEADVLRKAMGKKEALIMEQQREIFFTGAEAHSDMMVPLAEQLFDQIAAFAKYGFNKSHSAAYGLIAYQTAYLKANYSVEFLAAMLTCEKDNADKVALYVHAARDDDIEVLPPDINESEDDFIVTAGRIRFGLGAVKNVGAMAIASFVKEREQKPFADLFDFCERVNQRQVNKRVMESLIRGGAFDFTRISRARTEAALERAMERGQRRQRDRESGQTSLFDLIENAEPRSGAQPGALNSSAYPEQAAWPEQQFLTHEKEALGVYLTGHPLDQFEDTIRLNSDTNSRELRQKGQRAQVSMAGVIEELRVMPLRSGNGHWAIAMLEDQYGKVELRIPAKLFPEVETVIKGDEPILVQGRVQARNRDDARQAADDAPAILQIQASSIESLAEVRLSRTAKIHLYLQADGLSGPRLDKLKEILRESRGKCSMILHLKVGSQAEVILKPAEEWKVAPTDELLYHLKSTFGEDTVRLSR